MHTCNRCKDSYTSDETNALGHDYTAVVTNPTCTAAGYTTYTCSRCGNSYTSDEKAALGHAYSAWVKVDAANHRRVCANNAGHVETAAHTWDAGRITTAPTAEAEGVKTYTCTACGAVYTEAVDNSAEKAAAAAAAAAAAKEAADREAAEAAAEKINALSEAPTADDKAAAEEARAAYEALTPEQKALIPAETLARLAEAETQVKAAIEEKAAEEKRAAEEKAAAEKKAAEEKAAAEKKAAEEKAAAEAAAGKISGVPATEKLTEKDEKAVEEALAAYEALSEAEKALVPEETVKKLTEAKSRIAVLKAESADGTSAKNVEKTLTSRASDTDPKGSAFSPLKAKVSSAKNTSLTVSWTKVKGAQSYILYGNACGRKNKLVRLTRTTKNKVTVKKVKNKALKKGTYYKFIVVACRQENGYEKTMATSKVVHACTTGGKYTNAKKVTVNAAKATVKKGKNYSIKAKQVLANSKLILKKHRALSYESSSPKVATVTTKGVVKGISKGTAIIYVYSQNGICASVKITVN